MAVSTTYLCAGSPIVPADAKPTHSNSIELEGEAFWQAYLASSQARQLAALRGDFALAVRARPGCWVLAVDRFAVQTLCYTIEGDQIRFSQRADALAGSKGQVDIQAVFDYLYFHSIPSPRTIYRDIFRLPPGHFAIFEDGRISVQRYWVPEFHPDRSRSFEDKRSQFRDLLKSAVGRRLTNGQAACFLSGGTDSSTVVGMVAANAHKRPVSYSIGFDAEGYDEMEYARLAAQHFGSEHHEYYVTADDLVRDIPRMAAHFDQPFGNSSVLPAYYCARMARDHGADSILAGDGGDELFGGNARYAKQRVFGWYGHMPGPLSRYLVEPLLRSPLGGLPILSKGRSYVDQARQPMPLRLQMYNLLMRLGPGNVLTPTMLSQVDQSGPASHQQEAWADSHADSELNRTLAFDWRYTLAESDLPKVRYATGLAGIQVAYPLLDDEILAFSMTLPDSDKLKGLQLRWFFKEALRGFLPDQIITKPKHGFGLPFGVWLVQNPRLRTLAFDALRSLVRRGLVRGEFVESTLVQHLDEHPGYFGEMVWILMMLELWMQAHAGGKA